MDKYDWFESKDFKETHLTSKNIKHKSTFWVFNGPFPILIIVGLSSFALFDLLRGFGWMFWR
jgi:hypothetical protein